MITRCELYAAAEMPHGPVGAPRMDRVSLLARIHTEGVPCGRDIHRDIEVLRSSCAASTCSTSR